VCAAATGFETHRTGLTLATQHAAALTVRQQIAELLET